MLFILNGNMECVSGEITRCSTAKKTDGYVSVSPVTVGLLHIPIQVRMIN